MYNIKGDGNCLFRALCYIMIGSEEEHILLRRLIVHYMRSTAECSSLFSNYTEGEYAKIDEYIKDVKMDTAGTWGTTVEMLALAYMLGVNIVSYNANDLAYQLYFPGVIDFEAYGKD